MRPCRLAADLGGVAADPEPLARREHRLGTHPARPAGVPRQREPVDRVEGGDARPGHGPRTGLVALEGVVEPAHVPTDVDGAPGDGHAVRRVATGVVDPRRVVARAGRLPAGDRVAERPGPGPARERARRRDDEVGAVRGEVDVAHEGVERACAGVAGPLEAVGGPRGERRRGATGVEHGHLRARLATDGGEVADGDEARAVGGHVEALDVGRAAAVVGGVVDPGERDVDRGQDGAGGGIEGRQGTAGRRGPGGPDAGEPAADVDPRTADDDLVDLRAGDGVEGGDHGSGGGELDDALDGAVAADRAERSRGVDVGAVGVQRVDRAAEVGVERRVDGAGRGVEGEDPVADQVVTGVAEGVGGTHRGEGPGRDDLVAHLGDRVDGAVHDVRRDVGRVGRDDPVAVVGVDGSGGQRGRGQHRQGGDEQGGTLPGSHPHTGLLSTEEVVAHRPARSSPETVTHHARVLTQLRPTSPKSGSED